MSDDAAEAQRAPHAHDSAHDSADAEQSSSEATTGSVPIQSALVLALIEHEWRKEQRAKGAPSGTAPDVTRQLRAAAGTGRVEEAAGAGSSSGSSDG